MSKGAILIELEPEVKSALEAMAKRNKRSTRMEIAFQLEELVRNTPFWSEPEKESENEPTPVPLDPHDIV